MRNFDVKFFFFFFFFSLVFWLKFRLIQRNKRDFNTTLRCKQVRFAAANSKRNQLINVNKTIYNGGTSYVHMLWLLYKKNTLQQSTTVSNLDEESIQLHLFFLVVCKKGKMQGFCIFFLDCLLTKSICDWFEDSWIFCDCLIVASRMFARC